MKRKVSLVCLVVAVIFGSVFADASVSINWDQGKFDFDVPPQIVDGRTLVPVRAVFEEFGYDVSWDDNTKTVTAYDGIQTLSLTIDEALIKVVRDDETYVKGLDVPAQIIDGRTMVPLRVISDVSGVDVGWNNDTKTVLLKGAAHSFPDLTLKGFISVREDFDIKQLSYEFESTYYEMLAIYGDTYVKSTGVPMGFNDQKGTKFTYDLQGYEISYMFKNENPESDELAVSCYITGIPEGYRLFDIENNTTALEALDFFTEFVGEEPTYAGEEDGKYVIRYVTEYSHSNCKIVFGMIFDSEKATNPEFYYYTDSIE